MKNEIINVRQFAASYIKDKNSRILEFGPLNRCLLDRKEYANYFFADIKSTEDIKKFYCKNDYLEKTGLHVDIDSIIDIDFVINDTYKEAFKGVEKFDYVIVSHVLEHIPNLLFFFEDVQNILTKEGKVIILYPDRRFCFDAMRTDSLFSDIYEVYINNGLGTAKRVLDFFTNVINENDASKFWNQENEFIEKLAQRDYRKNLERYEEAKQGKYLGDVHFWPFSDYAFLKFLFEISKYKIFSFGVETFISTQPNTQEFLVILECHGKENDKKFFKLMQDSINNYTTATESGVIQRLKKHLDEKEKLITEKDIKNENLERSLMEEKQKLYNLEHSRSWRMTEPIRQLRKIVSSIKEPRN